MNILIFHFLSFKCYHRHNRTIQYLCAYGSDSEEDKEELKKVEDMSINVSESILDEDVAEVSFVII